MKIQRIEPGPGQESVWDYPRPPKLEVCRKQITVFVGDHVIVDTDKAYRILETSHPPVYYFPPASIRMDFLHRSNRQSVCEWKGTATYYSLRVDQRTIDDAAWSYEQPAKSFVSIAGYLAVYPGKMDRCFVDGELVAAQPGDFYGGWITSDIVGPFKGIPGSRGW